MKLSRLIIICSIVVLAISNGFSQLKENVGYDNNYYIFPIKPGLRNSLSGTMGELRSNHFHSGLDVRTDGRIGLPVHASANGFVSRIAVSTSGYGNAVYLQHPNGETTVYAHLDRFAGELANYIRKEQYRRKTFKLNLYFREGQFKVQQGDTIAYSGNSGSSGGPHLHYDIRDKNQKPLNPLTYGFEEIVDTTPPVVRKLAIKTLNKDSRVKGEFGRLVLTPRRVGNDYVLDQPISVKGEIGIELYAYDKLDNTRFRCGVNSIFMEVDSVETFRQTINTFSFAEQRNILAHMNYQQLYNSGERYHKLYVDDGNFLKFYKTRNTKGRLSVNEGSIQHVKITMTDSYGNKSYFNFKLRYSEKPVIKAESKARSKPDIKLIDNTLVIAVTRDEPVEARLTNTDKIPLQPAYVLNRNNAIHLLDMRNGLPETINTGGESIDLNYKGVIPSETTYQFYNEHVDISFPKHALFDTLYLQTNYSYDSLSKREIFNIGNQLTPIRKNITITIKPQQSYKSLSKAHVYFLNSANRPSYSGGKWEAGKITFRTRRFGKYIILEDTAPPKITLIRADRNDLRFKISDGLSGLSKFECTVGGKWVLMNYDHKRSLIWSEKLNKDIPFKGELKLWVTDNANNKTEYTKLIN